MKLSWIPGVLAAIFVIVVCGAASILFYLHWASLTANDRKSEFLADLGSFLAIASALFAGLAFAGVCATIPFLVAQANAARDQVQAAINQGKIADQTNNDSTRQGLFLALSQRVGEVISDVEIAKMPILPSSIIEDGLRDTQHRKGTDEEFLACQAKALRAVNIPQHDRFRRKSLFRALNRLISSCGDFQRELFKEALMAQIHDLAARMLIIKSLAEADLETLRIYGNLGINFEVLNEADLETLRIYGYGNLGINFVGLTEFPHLSAELTRRFSKKQDTKIRPSP